MRVRDLEEAIQAVAEGPRYPVVPRVKSRAATSLCGGNCRSFMGVARSRRPGYVFDRDCLCSSPEQHGAQFQDLSLLAPALGH